MDIVLDKKYFNQVLASAQRVLTDSGRRHCQPIMAYQEYILTTLGHIYIKAASRVTDVGVNRASIEGVRITQLMSIFPTLSAP
jgi:hypothetical protein